MIDVVGLSKRYHAVQAVDRLDFRVDRGEIVGFLGPNGAGKTTTMRMLTTFLAPTSGRAVLAGSDVLDDPLGVRRHVGYLPEGVPLPVEMRVREYLGFRARLKDIPRARRAAAIDRVLELCQIADVDRRVRRVTVPLIDLGPAAPPHAHAAIDLTVAAFRALGGDPKAGDMEVCFRIRGAAHRPARRTFSPPSAPP